MSKPRPARNKVPKRLPNYKLFRVGAPSFTVACSAGGFKGVFVHGVLAAFEAAGLRAITYAASSVSVFPAGAAAVGRIREEGLGQWTGALAVQEATGKPGAMIEWLTEGLVSRTKAQLFLPGAANLVIVASQVKNGIVDLRLGRRLLLAAARSQGEWAHEHLAPLSFDSYSRSLNPDNFLAVVQASTRLLHIWGEAVNLGGKLLIDASYTWACPVLALTGDNHRPIVAIATDPEPIKLDIFGNPLPDLGVIAVSPDFPPESVGVEVLKASGPGLEILHDHGFAQGQKAIGQLIS